MPISFNSPPRNLFLLGSSGEGIVTNFFKSIDQSAGTDGTYIPSQIKYNYADQKFLLSGSASDSNSKGFGWFEKRDYAGTSSTSEWDVRVEASASVNTTLRAMELDSGNNLIVVGKTGAVPWIAKYSNAGVLDWQSTTNTGDLEYTGITSDSNGNYYACGSTPESGEALAFVEKFDASGNPSWGKSAFMLGRDVVLEKISANSKGEVVAVGYLEDDSADKGYIIKIDSNTGEVIWDRTLERSISGTGGGISPDDIEPADVKCTACYIDSNDQIYVVGSIDGSVPIDNGVGEFLIKYSPEGNIIWQKERDTNHYTILDGAPNTIPFDVKSDGETEQTVVLSVEDQGSFALNNSDIFISKYSKNGNLVFRRKISKGNDNLGAASLDADPSFYYLLFRDEQIDGLAGEPDRYTFGKVSSSGNGLGAFQYNDGTGTGIDYTAESNPQNKIGRLSDGSVRNDSSDLITYPFTANKIVFDDLATHVSNKKRQMDGPDSFEYSGSPAIRPADFQELNLLGDVYSGSGNWLDQSGNDNDAVTSFTTTAEEPFSGAGSIEFDGSGDSISVGPLLPTSTGTAFTVDMFWRSKGNSGQKCIWEQHNSGAGRTAYFIDGTNAFLISEGNTVGSFAYSDNVWYFTRITYTSGGAIEVFVDGVSRGTGTQTVGVDNVNFVVGDRSGQSNEAFNGYVSNVRVITGSALSGAGQVPTSALTNTGQTTGVSYSTPIYSSMLTAPNSGTVKTPQGGFNQPHSMNQAGDRSEGVSGLLFTPTTPIPYSSQVEVLDNNTVTECYFNQTSASGSSTQHSTSYVTVASGSGTITSMYFQRTDNTAWDAGFVSIRVDGVNLEDTVSSPDDTIASNKPPSQLFDGNLSTRVESVNAGGTVRWTPTTTTSWNSSLRINTGAYSGSITVRANGTTTVIHPQTTQVLSPYWTSHPNSNGTIEYIEAQGHIGAGTGYMTAIEIDGTILVDSSGTTGTVLLTAQGGSITDASDSNLSITANGDAAAAVGGTNGPTYNAAGYWEFDGVDDYISIADDPSLHTEEMSWEWWMWNDALQPSGATAFLVKRTANTDGYMIFASGSGDLNIDFGTAVGLTNRWDTSYNVGSNLNQWIHCVLTRSTSNRKFYVNGVEYASTTNVGVYTVNASPVDLVIGADSSDVTRYNVDGRIGGVRIYPRALTAAQVFQNYNATKETYTGVAASTDPGLTSTRTP